MAFHRWRLHLYVAFLVTAPGLFAQDTLQQIMGRVNEFTLDNGLKFIVLERHQAPVVSVYTLVDAGSAQESKGITGLAHMFEHMAFKGTTTIGTTNYAEEKNSLDRVDQAFLALQKERSKSGGGNAAELDRLKKDLDAAEAGAAKFVVPNEFAQMVSRAGGRGLNASTGMDKTDYYYSLPSNAIELWFHTESDRFLNPVLREFYKEAGVVREERRMRIESAPIGRLLDEFLGVAYRAHPYGEPGVGHMSDLENLTRKDAQAFFDKYYTASNMTIGIVGDVDTNQIKQLAQLYFGRLPKREKAEPIRTVEPKQGSERRVTLRAQSLPIAVMGYHKPAITDKDNAVYEAINSLLSSGRSSRLWDSLVTKKQITVEAGGFTGFPGQKYPGVFVFYGVTAPGKTNAEVEKEMLAEIDRLKTELVTAEELDGVRNRARASLLSLMSSNPSMAGQMAQWQALTGDWRNLFRHLDQISKVTADDIQRVAKATFIDSNRTVALLEPQQRPPAR